jgi:hypothetical protein
MNNAFGRLTKSFTEPLVRCDDHHIQWWYVHVPALRERNPEGSRQGVRRSRLVGRSVVAGPDTVGPAGGRNSLHSRASALLLAVLLLAGCASAGATSKTTKKKSTTRKAQIKKAAATTRRPTTTIRRAATTTVAPKLSAEATAVLDGYEAYLVAFVEGSREPERARELYPKGMTGDALARLIEIADFDVSKGQYWDGTRSDITSTPRVQSIGATRSTVRDCRSVGGVLRKRASNEAIAGTSGLDVDDLVVDLVKLDGRWVVTRTDRTNEEEGKATCARSSP